ncbi:hypothetical protein CORC01_06678 [Colletotrichum orchidophilum]|uniref:Uncharacterized protein n=1 Tax=Colletotrichum orchidophilum TaxID=1209926 RepID=A0A1G4B9D1_9PEZI|nr:uncharacterized protein CORC01_06678 [Colletotrichum orchidophilum]OHE98009.1 hypothetical protein CORC01_06678 [Colletotrichum orchidophilum]
MPLQFIPIETCHSNPSASPEYGNRETKQTVSIEPAGASESSSAIESHSSINDETGRSQDEVVESFERPPHGITESEQPMTVEVAVAGDENNFKPIFAIFTLLEHSYITSTAVISMGLRRKPLATSHQAVSYWTPFGLFAPTHFVAMLIRGTEPGNPRFTVNVAVLDVMIQWQKVGIFIGEGLRSKAQAAIIEARDLRRLINVSQPLPRIIKGIEVDKNSATTYPEIGRDEGSPLDHSSSNLYYVGPGDANRLCPPSPASALSRSPSRIEAAGSPDTPMKARLSSAPTSFELDELSRCSREAQGHGGLARLSHDGHEALRDKVHAKGDMDSPESHIWQ